MINIWMNDGQIEITAPMSCVGFLGSNGKLHSVVINITEKTKEDFVNEEAEKMGLNIVKAQKPIAELEDEDEPEEPKNGKRRPIDDGKILALRKAGWSLQKIADEMHLSYTTVQNHLKNMEEAADEKVM